LPEAVTQGRPDCRRSRKDKIVAFLIIKRANHKGRPAAAAKARLTDRHYFMTPCQTSTVIM